MDHQPEPEVRYPDLKFECIAGCGLCCRQAWTISVDEPHVKEAIENSAAAARVRERGYAPLRVIDDTTHLGRVESGACVFLDEEQWCTLHAEVGIENKPAPCRHFPFQPVHVAGMKFVGLSFRCPAVQQNLGKAVSEHRDDIQRQIRYLEAKYPEHTSPEDFALEIRPGLVMGWDDYQRLELDLFSALKSASPGEGLWQIALELAGSRRNLALANAREFFRDYGGILLASFECPHTPANREPLVEALKSGQDFYSERKGQIMTFPRTPPPFPDWYASEARRYTGHYVFRKELCDPYPLGRLLLLILALELLEFYTLLEHAQSQEKEIARQHLYAAMGAVDGVVVATYGELEQLVEIMQANFLEQVA